MINLDNYWAVGFRQVDGWVDDRLLDVLKVVGSFQSEAGIIGNIAEIGVYHGRFLIALAHLARPNELCVAVDVFADQAKNLDGSGVGDVEKLGRNLAAYAPPELRYRIVQADSLALTARQRLELGTELGPFRLFSIDGGHSTQHTVNDLLLGQDLLAAGGVIFVDDYFNKHWPGVTEGIAGFYAVHSPRVAPFLFAFNKLCVTGIAHHKVLLDKCIANFRGRHEFKIVKMYGFEVAVF